MKLNRILAVLVFISLNACGQNPSLVKAPQLDAAHQASAVGPTGANGPSGATGSTGPSGATGSDNGLDPSRPIAELPGVPTPPSTMPSSSPSSLAAPIGNNCVQQFQGVFPARKLTKDEVSYHPFIYPYKSGAKHSIKVINLGGEMPAGGHNAQVVMAFNVDNLPPRDSITGVESAVLSMNVVTNGHYQNLDHQILCFLDEKICSGQAIDTIKDSTYADTINEAFFEKGKPVLSNLYFSSQHLPSPYGRYSGLGAIQLDMDPLLEGSGLTPLDILYGKEARNKRIKKDAPRTLYVLVAEDSYVRSGAQVLPYIAVTLNFDACRAYLDDGAMDKPTVPDPKPRKKL